MDDTLINDYPSLTQKLGLHEQLANDFAISEIFDVDASTFPDDFTTKQYKYAYALLYNNNYNKLTDLLDYIGWKRK